MRCSPYVACVALLAGFGGVAASAQTNVVQAVTTFNTAVQNYNVITSGNLTLHNTHTDGAIAVGGNLNLSGDNVLVMHGQTEGSNPGIYLKGQLNISGNSYLNNGYVYAPNLAKGTTYTNTTDGRYLQNGGTLRYNTSAAGSYVDPRDATAPSGWALSSAFSTLTSVSNTLAAATATGTINFSSNSIQLSTSLTSGVAVFNLNANQITGLTNVNIEINVPQNMVYVINVINADGKTLFGGGGINFNKGQNNDQLLWNIVADSNPATSRTVALGTNFYGSILAPMLDITNGSGGEQNYVNGQIVAANYSHSGAEVHHVKFKTPSGFSSVPEPATWSVFGLAGAALMMGCRRRRRAA